jgi:hypothetical protein
MIERNRNPSARDLRQFGLLLAGFVLLAGWLLGRRFDIAPPWPLLGALSAVSFVVALARPTALRLVFLGWGTATWPISWVVSHVLLALVFYGILTPVGLLVRLSGRDPMQRKLEPAATSYWQRRPPPRDRKSYFRPF